MTALQSKLIVTDEGQIVRARIVHDASGAPTVELTQLHKRPDGMGAEHARVFLPLWRIEDLTSALLALRADLQNAKAQAEGRNRLSPVTPRPKPKTARAYGEGEF
jgi:hypothetical protein